MHCVLLSVLYTHDFSNKLYTAAHFHTVNFPANSSLHSSIGG